MKPIRKILLLTTFLVPLLASCSGTVASISRPADDWVDVEVRRIQPIRIGIALSTSGAGSEAEARDIFQAAELAARDAGLVHGYQIELAEFNTQCSAAGGRSAALSIVNDLTLIAVIGPSCSEACEASTAIFESAHYTFVSPSCSGGASNAQSSSGGAYLHTMYDSRVEAELAAQFAYSEVGARHILAIGDGTSDVTNNLAAFETRFLDLGGKVEETRTLNLSAGREQVLGGLTGGSFDLIYAPLGADNAASVVEIVSKSEFAEIPILGGRYYLSQWLLDSRVTTSAKLYAVGPALSNPEYLSMAENFSQLYGANPTTVQAAYAYDAVRLVIGAIDTVASLQPNGNLLIGRSDVRSALYSTAAYHGLTGTLTCSISGDCSGANIGVSQVINGEWALVYVP
jgi:branched-chain amino acid transport system substrate-binding protein